MSRKVSSRFNQNKPLRFFGEHDDRGEQFMRRVHDNQGRISKKNHKWNRVRDRLGDWDDANMDNQAGGQRMAGGSGQHYRGSGRGGRGRGAKSFAAGALSATIKRGYWYQITVVNGSRYGRPEILACLEGFLAPQKFFPICYQIVRSDSVFYVETWATAQLLLSCTRKITMNDGEPLVLRIKEGKPPFCPIDAVTTNKIKQVMAKRYLPQNKALDLSRFVRDPEFIDGLYCSLNRGPVLSAVLKIINENIPDLVALNLSGNNIYDFEAAAQEFKDLKNLRILHISENMIANLNALNCFKDMLITELVIEKNPVCQTFTDNSHFVRYDPPVTEVRKRFPKLTKLDKTELMPVVSFDVAEEGALPVARAACICVPEGRDFVKAFLSQYYQIYDSDNRVELTQAYSENAVFSLISNYPPFVHGAPQGPRLNSYFGESRNLLRVTDFPRRKNKLRQGRAEVVDFLFKHLPKTQHDLPSFVVDLAFFMPELIQLSVAGIFRETGVGSSANWPLRYFSRTFLIVPTGAGFCIANDMLYVTNCTEDQKAAAFLVEPVPSAVSSPTPAPVASPSVPAMTAPPLLDDTVKMQMVQTVAQQTGMNLDWSRKCLEETAWDFQRAAYTFNELQKRGAIPAEAFIK